MAVDTDEQQEELIKKFLIDHKAKIILVSLLIFTSIIGRNVYFNNKVSNSERASQIYQEILIENEENYDIINAKVELIKNKYSKTPYAARSAIYFSKILSKNNKIDDSINELLWAASYSPEEAIKSMANFFLASQYLAEKKFEDALAISEQITSVGYSGLVNDLVGDIYMATGDKKSAIDSYQKALDYFGGQGELYKVIQNKKDAISP